MSSVLTVEQREHNNLTDTWAFAYAQLYRKHKRWK